MTNRKLRMGMVGGGPGSFIGNVHRMAARLDGQIELVCGIFSADFSKSLVTAKELFIDENRVYRSFEEMIESEKLLPETIRMDFISIVTPNHLHFEPARKALENGFDVVCDKPIAFDIEQAQCLVEIVKKTGLLFCLTYNYTGYPMVRQAREMIEKGVLGKIRKVLVEYPQGWLASPVENMGSKQAVWRTDPKKSGKGGCIGDIGTHAVNLAEFVTGLKIKELAVDITTFVEGRLLDDDCSALLRFENGAKGTLTASQVSIGEENNLKIRVYGDKAGLEWSQTENNSLFLKHPDRPTEIYRTGNQYLEPSALIASRLPPGHPEGYLEAFANLYREFANTFRMQKQGIEHESWLPNAEDGLRGMQFIDAAITSSENNSAWVRLPA